MRIFTSLSNTCWGLKVHTKSFRLARRATMKAPTTPLAVRWDDGMMRWCDDAMIQVRWCDDAGPARRWPCGLLAWLCWNTARKNNSNRPRWTQTLYTRHTGTQQVNVDTQTDADRLEVGWARLRLGIRVLSMGLRNTRQVKRSCFEV
jgi:hypothetical protein